MSWKKLFLTGEGDETQNKKEETPKKVRVKESMEFPTTKTKERVISEPVVGFPEVTSFETPKVVKFETQSIKSDNTYIQSVTELYENGFNQLNKEGVDFFELYQSVTNSDINNPEVYKMAFNLLKGMDPTFTKERALSDGEFYIDKIEEAYDGMKNSGETLISNLTIQKESEEKNLVDELADLETQLDELKNKVASKKTELTLIDTKFSGKFKEAKMKFDANELVKTALTSKIKMVINNIKTNI
jgi:hypothetical protein